MVWGSGRRYGPGGKGVLSGHGEGSDGGGDHARGVSPTLDSDPGIDTFGVNRPGGAFVAVRQPAIAGREVERRRLVDAVRRIVAVAPALAEPPDPASSAGLDALLGRLEALVPDEEDRLARMMPPLPVAGGDGGGPFGEADVRGSVVVGNATGMVSGMYNPISPSVLDVVDGRIVGFATFGELHRALGDPAHVHDGVVSACFDVVLAMANRLHGMFGPTMELSCTRLAPTRIGVPCRFEADVDWYRDKVVVASGQLVQEGVVTVEASGAFRRFDQAGIVAVGRLRSSRGATGGPAPGAGPDVTRGDVP